METQQRQYKWRMRGLFLLVAACLLQTALANSGTNFRNVSGKKMSKMHQRCLIWQATGSVACSRARAASEAAHSISAERRMGSLFCCSQLLAAARRRGDPQNLDESHAAASLVYKPQQMKQRSAERVLELASLKNPPRNLLPINYTIPTNPAAPPSTPPAPPHSPRSTS
jgi:hypothetical protein